MKINLLIAIILFVSVMPVIAQTETKSAGEPDVSDNIKKLKEENKFLKKSNKLLRKNIVLNQENEDLKNVDDAGFSDSRKTKYDSLVITYNARTNKANIYPPYNIQQNGYLKFNIEDINLFRYSITVTELQNNIINSAKLSEGNTSISFDPSLFTTTDVYLNIHFLPAVKNETLYQLNAIEREISSTQSKIKRKEEEYREYENSYNYATIRLDKIKSISDSIEIMEFLIDNMQLEVDKKSELGNEIKLLEFKKGMLVRESGIAKDEETRLSFISKKMVLLDELDTIKEKLNNLEKGKDVKSAEDITNSKSYDDFNKLISNYIDAVANLNQLTDLYKRLISILYSDQSFVNILNEKEQAVKDALKIIAVRSDTIMKIAYERFRRLDSIYYEMAVSFSRLPNDTNAKETFAQITAFHRQINPNYYHAFFQQLIKVYDAINESNFNLSYQTLILSDNADIIKFNLKCEPQLRMPSSIETKPINFTYNVNIKNGVKIDVSTGIFWNFGLNDYTYRFESINDSTSRVIKEDNENLFIPSFGLLFNVYERTNRDIKFGGNVGFSANAEKLNYYIGASILIGKSERININIGLAGAQVNRVSDLYNTKEPIPVALKDLPDQVPLQNPNPFRVGGFFGITFNLIGDKNKESLSQISAL